MGVAFINYVYEHRKGVKKRMTRFDKFKHNILKEDSFKKTQIFILYFWG